MSYAVEFAAVAFTNGHFNAASLPEMEKRRCWHATHRETGAAGSMFPKFDVVVRATQAAATEWVRAAEQGTGSDDSVHTFIGQRLHALVVHQ